MRFFLFSFLMVVGVSYVFMDAYGDQRQPSRDQKQLFHKDLSFSCASAQTGKRFRLVPHYGEIFEYNKKGEYIAHVDLLEVRLIPLELGGARIKLLDPSSRQVEAVLFLEAHGDVRMSFRPDRDGSIRCKVSKPKQQR